MIAIIERLYVCWLVLTSHTYYTFFVSKKPKVKGAFIENPSKIADEAIIEYLKSDKYKKLINNEL